MKEEKINIKSDVDAKEAFVSLLIKRGYEDVRIASSPADIIAIKEGVKHYFEIKFTNQKENYFGAATLTEWGAAIDHPKHFWFVIARKNNGQWEFTEYAPEEFIKFNTVPPFKTYFNICLSKNCKKSRNSQRSTQLTEERLKQMRTFWENLKRK